MKGLPEAAYFIKSRQAVLLSAYGSFKNNRYGGTTTGI